MRHRPSKQTTILLIGLALVAFVASWLLWETLADGASSGFSASNESAAANRSASNALDGGSSSTDARRAAGDARESAAVVLAAASSPAAAEESENLVDVVIRAHGSDKPVPRAELTYWALPEAEQRNINAWKWLGAGEFDAHLQQDGETSTADDEGKARVKRPKRGAIVAARSGALWGYAEFGRKDESPWRLELYPDVDLSARVVDSRNLPVGGALVVVRSRVSDWFWDIVMAETRESDGLAILPHAGFLIESNGGVSQAMSIALGAVLERPVEVALDVGHLSNEPVKLVVPATGECDVLVLGPDGAACTDELDISLRPCTPTELTQAESPPSDQSALQIRAVRGGRALFHHVAPGLELIATATRVGSSSNHSARAKGPIAAGQHASITIRLGESVAILRGRALDAKGSPLAKAKLRAWLEGDKDEPSGSDHTWDMQSDEAGRFQVDVRPRGPDDGACALVLVHADDDGAELGSASHPLPAVLRAGIHDVGDIALALVTPIVSGRVVDRDGAPVRNATIQVSVKHRYGEGETDFSWEQLWNLRARSGADGRFELHGRAPADTIAIWAVKQGARAEAVMVSPGASDVVLRMLQTGEIAGRVWLDPAMPRANLLLFAEQTDAAQSEGPRSTAWSPGRLSDDGNFLLRDVRAGVYTVRLRNTMSWDDLVSIEGVSVESGKTSRDPRLDPLDLRASLSAIHLTIVDPEGVPLTRGNVQSTERATARVSMTQFENGKTTITHDGQGVDLVIWSTGFRDTRLEQVHADQQVTLSPAPRVKLVLASGQRVPEPPFLLGVNLMSAEGNAARHWGSNEDIHFDARGQLSTFAPAVGRVRVELSLNFRPDQHSWYSTGLDAESEIILDVRDVGTEQTFEIACDAEKLDATMKEMRKDRR